MGTDDVVISCQVTGITATLGTVKWTFGGTEVADLTDPGDYSINTGSLVNSNSQTTTLTVKAAKTTADRNYSCLITPAAQDDATEVSTVVALNVYSKSLV